MIGSTNTAGRQSSGEKTTDIGKPTQWQYKTEMLGKGAGGLLREMPRFTGQYQGIPEDVDDNNNNHMESLSSPQSVVEVTDGGHTPSTSKPAS